MHRSLPRTSLRVRDAGGVHTSGVIAGLYAERDDLRVVHCRRPRIETVWFFRQVGAQTHVLWMASRKCRTSTVMCMWQMRKRASDSRYIAGSRLRCSAEGMPRTIQEVHIEVCVRVTRRASARRRFMSTDPANRSSLWRTVSGGVDG